MLSRDIYTRIHQYREIFPVVTILGPRQCGKSTLAKLLISDDKTFIYLDLERNIDLNKLNEPELYFKNNPDKNICIDEIQLKPDLFKVLRSVIDENRINGRFLILGSASKDLIQQSSESLAGRIGYIELTPFTAAELENNRTYNLNNHWLRGGFPDSYLQKSDESSFIWRENFIRTFVERDVIQLGMNIPSLTTRRLLSMSAHNHGQLLNSSKLGESLGLSYHTIQNYLNLLEQLFIVRSLRPYFPNTKKRIMKSPKVYIRDSGLLHWVLNIENMNDLMGHPVFGPSWEGYCIENIVTHYRDWQPFFYKTSSGNEIDLILEKGNKKIAIEIKASISPKVTKGIYQALEDLGTEKLWIITPTDETYSLNERIQVISLIKFLSLDI